ncbi:MAG: L,D-transpeptidase family protein [Gammaproteobacteria bacterium]
MLKPINLLFLLFQISIANPLFANTYFLPVNTADSIVGEHPDEDWYATAKDEDTLLDIARDYNIGQNEILLANQNVDRWLPKEGTRVRIPMSHILPDAPRRGLVLNLSEFRLYYFPEPKKGSRETVTTHPISIGRMDWKTPLGLTQIVGKTRNPTWTPPQSIREEHAAKGDILPAVVPAGPDNPLGLFAMRLGIPGYLIHSTNKPFGVGMRVSHGCIRMYPEDIEILFPSIPVGAPVMIVNQPIKVGWLNDTLYIQVYPELEEEEADYEERLEIALNLIQKANNNKLPILDGSVLRKALEERIGIPVAIHSRHDDEMSNLEINE